MSSGRKIAWAVGVIFFAIGFWHTGKGLEEANLFGVKFGGYVLSAGVTLALAACFHFAMERKPGFLVGFVVLALFNVACNFNYFWPHYAGRGLVADEMSELQLKLTKIASAVQNEPQLPTLTALKSSVEAARDALVVQVRTRGVGPEAKRQIDNIEKLLPGAKLSVQSAARTQPEWDRAADSYKEEVDGLLSAALRGAKFAELQVLRRDAEQTPTTLGKDLSAAESVLRGPLAQVTEDDRALISKAVQTYNQLCTRAKQTTDGKFRCDGEKLSRTKEEQTEAKNVGLGSFAHTASSATDSIFKMNFWAILGFCLLIDFIAPYLLYRLGRIEITRRPWDQGNPAGIG